MTYLISPHKWPLLTAPMEGAAREAHQAREKTSATMIGTSPCFNSHEFPSNIICVERYILPDIASREISNQSLKVPRLVFVPQTANQFRLEQGTIHVKFERTYDSNKVPRYAVLEMEEMVKQGSSIYSEMKGYGIVENIVENFGYYVAVRVAFPTHYRDKDGQRLFDKFDILFPTINVEMNQEMRCIAWAWEKRHPEFALELVEKWDSC